MSQSMSQSQLAEVERIRGLVAKVDREESLSRAERGEILDTFEEYECWAPFFRLIQRSLRDPAFRQISDYVRLARVQNMHLEDAFAAAETCSAMVTDLKTSYQEFVEEVLPKVVRPEDFATESTVLSAVCDRFTSAADHVSCLERLCMIYEKKTHNEARLSATYERLLEVQPKNVKALRYFKLLYTQNGDWEEVASILRTLLTSVSHPQEVFRVAQELSAILLYQLDRPEQAIHALQTYCADSPLDSSTILYEAYQRLADWPGCLRVLRQCLLNVEDEVGQAIIHYKIASLLEQGGDLKAALEHYGRASALWPQLLDALEGQITVAVGLKDWDKVLEGLNELSTRVQEERLATQLKQAVGRVQDGLRVGAQS